MRRPNFKNATIRCCFSTHLGQRFGQADLEGKLEVVVALLVVGAAGPNRQQGSTLEKAKDGLTHRIIYQLNLDLYADRGKNTMLQQFFQPQDLGTEFQQQF